MLRRLLAVAAVLSLPACGVPQDPLAVPITHQRQVRLPLSVELSAEGGAVELLRLPPNAPLERSRVVVAKGQTELVLDAEDAELVAYSQQVNGMPLAAALVQAGCETPYADTGVVLRVPEDHQTIQGAIDLAAPGDTVLVGPGTFTEFLRLRPGVRLRGSGADRTVLDAKGRAENLVDLTGAPGVVISGFTFMGVPMAEVGCSRPEDPFHCSGDWYRAAIFGDGHWLMEEAPEAEGCAGASALVTQNVFRDNFIAVMPYFHTRLVVANNVFVQNAYGYVANRLQDRGALLNNVFLEQAELAVGITAGYVDVVNNVLARSGAGYFQGYVQEGRIACNVLWDNALDERPSHDGATPRLLVGAEGNVALDPLFVSFATGDFNLGPQSPAKDAGCAALGELDLDGSPIDIGAYGGMLGSW